jgi:hypothetical protein
MPNSFKCKKHLRSEPRSATRGGALTQVGLVLLLGGVVSFGACSYVTDFVVINESANPVDLRYKIKNLPGPFSPRIAPAKMTSAQLRAGDHPWEELDKAQYSLDPVERTVTVRLMPNEALRIERMQRAGMQIDETEDAKSFSIEELSISGTNGEIKLEGERVRKGFTIESKRTRALTYQ